MWLEQINSFIAVFEIITSLKSWLIAISVKQDLKIIELDILKSPMNIGQV